MGLTPLALVRATCIALPGVAKYEAPSVANVTSRTTRSEISAAELRRDATRMIKVKMNHPGAVSFRGEGHRAVEDSRTHQR